MALNKSLIESILAKESIHDLVHWIQLSRQSALHLQAVFLNNPHFHKIYENFEKKGLLTHTHQLFFQQQKKLSEAATPSDSPSKTPSPFRRP